MEILYAFGQNFIAASDQTFEKLSSRPACKLCRYWVWHSTTDQNQLKSFETNSFEIYYLGLELQTHDVVQCNK